MVKGPEHRGTAQEPRESWHSVEQLLVEGKWLEHWNLVELSWTGLTGRVSG